MRNQIEHPFSSQFRPEGRTVVWIGTEWAPVEHGPMDLPGIVTCDLPDGWALVTWVDKDSWYCPDAVYETRNLAEVSADEFEARVTALRDSDWPGLVKQPIVEDEPPFEVGDTVRWTGRGDPGWEPRHGVRRRHPLRSDHGLTRHHPGTVIELSDSARVRIGWVDKRGEVESHCFVYPVQVERIDADTFAALARALRESDWRGLDPD